MKSLNILFNEYSADHQNPLNQKIHYICVPVIIYSLLGLLWTIPEVILFNFQINFSWLFILGVTIYYLLLNIKHAFVMLATSLLMLFTFNFIHLLGFEPIYVFLILFTLAWVGQFYGHKVEGKKPSFLTDLTYLFIGPLWVVEKVFFKKLKKQ